LRGNGAGVHFGGASRFHRAVEQPDEIRRVIVNHLSPVIMGCKPAALFTLQTTDVCCSLADTLPRGLDLMVLRKSENGLLVFVFEKALLEKTMAGRAAGNILAARGYPSGGPVAAVLSRLKKRFSGDVFPHEIGLFLGYPAADVLGFVEHGGRDYKLCGYWKVYGNVRQALRRFRQYDECRERLKTALIHSA
jgi:hypothetical protein